MTTSHVPGLFTEAGAQLNQGKFAKTWDDSAGAMGRPVGGTREQSSFHTWLRTRSVPTKAFPLVCFSCYSLWSHAKHNLPPTRLKLYLSWKQLQVTPLLLGRPGGSHSKDSTCNARHPGSIPGSGRPPWEGNGNPLQDSCLKNPMDGGAWWAAVHWVTKSQTWLSGQAHTLLFKKGVYYFSYAMIGKPKFLQNVSQKGSQRLNWCQKWWTCDLSNREI